MQKRTIPPSLTVLTSLVVALSGCNSDGVVSPSFNGKGDGFSDVHDLGALAFGASADHVFDEDFQFFSYSFDARQAAEVSIEVTQRGTARGLDTTLFLYRMAKGELPQRIAFDDNDGFGGLSKLEKLRLFSDDRYAIVIGTKGANGRGAFRVALECVSGDCGPLAVPDDDCPIAMQGVFLACVAHETAEAGFEPPLSETASEVCATKARLGDVQAELCAETNSSWCETDEVIAACEGFAADTYPAVGDLGSELGAVTNSAMNAMVDGAHEGPNCGELGPNAGCQISGVVFEVAGLETLALEGLLAHSRAMSIVGPGVFPEQHVGADAVDPFNQFLSRYGMQSNYSAVLDSLNLSRNDAVLGFATGAEFPFNFGDCNGSIAVAYFPDDGLVLDMSELVCTG